MKYKYNGQWYDVSIKALDGMPIGSIILFAGETIPTGWLICDGDTLNEEEYPELFDVIGHTYGGSGLDFNLPNFKGRVPVGLDTTDTDFDTLGETGGEKTHTLTVDEMPQHRHTYEKFTDPSYFDNNGSGQLGGYYNITTNTGYAGGDQPHNNLQPYLVVNYIIKATNTTPTMASVVNTTNNSTVDTYSCDYINNVNTYSTTETDTGKTWIDGKKIYRRVFSVNSPSSNADTQVASIGAFSSLVFIFCSVDIGVYGLSPVPQVFDNGNQNKLYIDGKTNGNIFMQVLNGAYYSKPTTIIVEYTKTTD